MAFKQLIVITSLAALSVVGTAVAQVSSPVGAGGPHASPPARPRIEVNPRPLLYRRCASWYELQYRPSGTVLYPAKHCWWVRG